MNIDITDLKHQRVEYIEVDQTFNASQEELQKAGIIELKDVKVKGTIYPYDNSDYELNMLVEGTMVLPCSMTLKPVDYSFSTEFDGIYTEMMEEIENFNKKVENSLDIFPIIWENILMEIPIKVSCPDATDLKLSGDGWKLVTEESEHTTKNAFDKLKDLL